MGVEVGVGDQRAFQVCLESEASASAVMSDLNAGFELGVSGTPTFLVNGRKSVGVLDSLSFTDIYRDIRR